MRGHDGFVHLHGKKYLTVKRPDRPDERYAYWEVPPPDYYMVLTDPQTKQFYVHDRRWGESKLYALVPSRGVTKAPALPARPAQSPVPQPTAASGTNDKRNGAAGPAGGKKDNTNPPLRQRRSPHYTPGWSTFLTCRHDGMSVQAAAEAAAIVIPATRRLDGESDGLWHAFAYLQAGFTCEETEQLAGLKDPQDIQKLHVAAMTWARTGAQRERDEAERKREKARWRSEWKRLGLDRKADESPKEYFRRLRESNMVNVSDAAKFAGIQIPAARSYNRAIASPQEIHRYEWEHATQCMRADFTKKEAMELSGCDDPALGIDLRRTDERKINRASKQALDCQAITYKDARKKLLEAGPGSYLVRRSQSQQGRMVLECNVGGEIFDYRVVVRQGQSMTVLHHGMYPFDDFVEYVGLTKPLRG